MAADTTTPDGDDGAADRDFVPFLGQFFPESLSLAAFLSLLAFVATIPALGLLRQVDRFTTGFYGFFTVQMSLILAWVLPAAIVESRTVGRGFDWIAARLPTGSQRQVIFATGLIAVFFGWINWALGLVGSFVVGRAVSRRAAERGVRVHYPAVLTASLLSLPMSAVGLTSPGALLMADATGRANFLVSSLGSEAVVPLRSFLTRPVTLVSTLVFVVALPALLVVLAPSAPDERTPITEYRTILSGSIADRLDHYSPPPRSEWRLADRLEHSRAIAVLTFLLGSGSLIAHFAGGGRLTLPWFLFAAMMIGILVQQYPMAYVEKTESATRWANHLAVPFLFYAGTYALLEAGGLYAPIGEAIAATGFPQVVSYLVALVLGLFVPSPGSVWLLQSQAMLATDLELGAALVPIMYGAGISNLWLGSLFVGILAPVTGFEYREFFRYVGAITVLMSIVLAILLVAF